MIDRPSLVEGRFFFTHAKSSDYTSSYLQLISPLMKTKTWQAAMSTTATEAPGDTRLGASEVVYFNSKGAPAPLAVPLLNALALTILCLRRAWPCEIERESGERLFSFDGQTSQGTDELSALLNAFEYHLLEERKLGHQDVLTAQAAGREDAAREEPQPPREQRPQGSRRRG